MTTLITGAAGALGSTLARTLSAAGHTLVLVDVEAAHNALVALQKELPNRAFIAAFDGNDAERWTRELSQWTTSTGNITAAALIAGGWQGGGPVHTQSNDNVWNAMMERNANTVWHALRALLPSMVERKDGSIVVVGSRNVANPASGAGAAAYVASKSAAVALAQATAAEVLHANVRINAVLPSTMDTSANRSAMPDADPTRWVSLDSMSGVIAFLLSPAARDISGAALPVYGRA